MPVEPRSPAACTRSSMKNEPLEGNLHYGTEDREFLDRDPIQPDLLPTQLNLLRWKLNQKAKREPNTRCSASACDDALAGKPDSGNLSLRFDEGSGLNHPLLLY